MAECADCHATAEELAAASKDGNVRMMVHLADGVYALMCRKCSDAYALKRADLYGETQYGKERGIGT